MPLNGHATLSFYFSFSVFFSVHGNNLPVKPIKLCILSYGKKRIVDLMCTILN
jgi:hypothetical protein